jgi:3-hydroxyacyl-[acyl-carrier-protein] dehydratase
VIGIAGIKRVIPHRHPVLMLDRVSEVEPGVALVAYQAITGREPCYQQLGDDAAPDAYAYPVGQLLESWAQAAVLLLCWEHPNPDVVTGKVELISSIRHVILPGQAYPGDVLEHRVELVRSVDDAAVFTGTTLVRGRPVVEIGMLTVARRGVEMLAAGNENER